MKAARWLRVIRDATNSDRASDAWKAASFLQVDLISLASNGNRAAGIVAARLKGSSKVKLV